MYLIHFATLNGKRQCHCSSQLSDNVAEGSVELIEEGKISDTERVSGDKNKHRSTIDCDNIFIYLFYAFLSRDDDNPRRVN